MRAHRVSGGICADVTHCKSGLWSCIDCECFVPEKEQLPYFKEQAAEWAKKAAMFRTDIQIANNFGDFSRRFDEIVELLEKR